MPFVIRHKETGEIIKMRSGKSVWAKIAHAKASFRTSGLTSKDRIRFDYKPDPNVLGADGLRLGRAAWKFEHQDLFEIVEAKLEPSDQLARAIALLRCVIHTGVLTAEGYQDLDELEVEICSFINEVQP